MYYCHNFLSYAVNHIWKHPCLSSSWPLGVWGGAHIKSGITRITYMWYSILGMVLHMCFMQKSCQGVYFYKLTYFSFTWLHILHVYVTHVNLLKIFKHFWGEIKLLNFNSCLPCSEFNIWSLLLPLRARETNVVFVSCWIKSIL